MLAILILSSTPTYPSFALNLCLLVAFRYCFHYLGARGHPDARDAGGDEYRRQKEICHEVVVEISPLVSFTGEGLEQFRGKTVTYPFTLSEEKHTNGV